MIGEPRDNHTSMQENERASVLIVDDEIDLLAPSWEILSQWGYETVCRSSAEEALRIMQERPFDILLTDVSMPEMNGIELLKSTKAFRPSIVCLVMSGQGTIHTAVEALKHGAFDFVIKPFDYKFLKLTLARATGVSQLKKSEETYRTIVEGYQTEFICRFLPDGTLTFINDAYCRHHGKTREELLGRNLLSFIHEEDKENIKQILSSIVRDRTPVSFEYRIINTQGTVNWHCWNNYVIFDKSGHVMEIQAIGRDISERKRIEEQLRMSEMLYRTIFENTGTATVIIEEDMTISMTNMEAEKLSGYAREELEGKKRWTDFVVPEEIDRLKDYHYARHSNPDIVPSAYETRISDRKGNVRNVFVIAAMIPNSKRRIVSIQDVTERNQLEWELKKRIEELEEFYGIALGREKIIRDLREEIGSLQEELKTYRHETASVSRDS